MQTFFFKGNVIIVSYMDKTIWWEQNYLELIDQKIHTPNKNIGKTVLSVPIQLLQCYFQNSYSKFLCLNALVHFPLRVHVQEDMHTKGNMDIFKDRSFQHSGVAGFKRS